MTAPSPHLADKGEPIVVSPAKAMVMLDCGLTHLYRLLNTGELESFHIGKSRKILVSSIHGYIERRLNNKQPNLRTPGRRDRRAG